LEIPPSLQSAPNHLIAEFVLSSLQPPTPSLYRVWRGGFSLTLPKDMVCLVFIKLGQPSPYKPVL